VEVYSEALLRFFVRRFRKYTYGPSFKAYY